MNLDDSYTLYHDHPSNDTLTGLFKAVRLYTGAIVRDYDLPDPDDTISEIVVRVWQRLDTYAPAKGKLSTWVRTVARNYIFDVYRRLDRRIVTVTMPSDFGSYV